jgi:hypothetical protein
MRCGDAESPTITLTWYAFPPRVSDATAPRPAKHSKLGRLMDVIAFKGQRPGLMWPPPLVAVFQPTITTTAPLAGTRYAAIWHCVDFATTPSVPTTNDVRGSVTRPSEADTTRCHPAGTVNATPCARTVRPLLLPATETSASTNATRANDLTRSSYGRDATPGPLARPSAIPRATLTQLRRPTRAVGFPSPAG